MSTREPCPKCRDRGADRSGDNLITMSSGNKKCFACGYYVSSKPWKSIMQKEDINYDTKSLPTDFTREVPAKGWKWLLQYGLSYSYWKEFTGYSPKEDRLIIKVGNPVRFSQGRDLSGTGTKWKTYGKPHDDVTILGESSESTCTVLVEDMISAHKVAQVHPCMCLFGTNINSRQIIHLTKTNKPVILWLDGDQLPAMKKKVNKLSLFLPNTIKVIHTDKDPKEFTLTEIKNTLKDTI